MHTCRACGAIIGRQFRFCSQCGAPVGAELNLLDVAPVVGAESTVRHGQSGRFWAAVVGGFVVLGIGIWLLGRLGGTDNAHAPPEPARSTTTTRPALGTTVGAGPSTAPAADTTSGDATTTVPPVANPATFPTETVGDGQPLLGAPTGLSLLVGSDTALRRIDLDSGIVTRYPFGGTPEAVSGAWLVLASPTDGSVGAVPLTDLGAGRRDLSSPSRFVAATAQGPAPGQIWLLELGGIVASWRLVRIDDATTLAQIPLGPESTPFAPPDPAIAGSAAGGVFVHQSDGYRKVAEGQVVAVSDAYVLTQTCTQPDQCQLHWLDRSAWQPVDRSLPAAGDRPGVMGPDTFLSPGGRMLGYTSGRGDGRLFDVERSRTMATLADPGSIGASPDGRFVATPEAGRVMVYDTETGTSHDVSLGLVAASRIVFAPTAAFASSG